MAEPHTPLVDLLVIAKSGSCSGREIAFEMSFQLMRSFEACIGMPGKTEKEEEAQKNVQSYSGTDIQLGSG